MRTSPPDTPEARAHAAECTRLEDKLRAYCAEQDVEEVFDQRRTNRPRSADTPALRVVPTADETGRVHMTIDQLAALLDLPRGDLSDPALSLSSLLDED